MTDSRKAKPVNKKQAARRAKPEALAAERATGRAAERAAARLPEAGADALRSRSSAVEGSAIAAQKAPLAVAQRNSAVLQKGAKGASSIAREAVPAALPPVPAPPPPDFERDSYSTEAFSEVLDRSTHAAIARATRGLAPSAFASAYLDWLVHLSTSPGKTLQLQEKALRKLVRLSRFALKAAQGRGKASPCIKPLPQDRRFRGDDWQSWPFNVIYQSFLLQQQWWHLATTGVSGVTAKHEQRLEFMARQMLDVMAPSNFIATNPEVLRKTMVSGGLNLWQGLQYFLDDVDRLVSDKPPAGTKAFQPGQSVAVTPGKIVYRNRLIELIQYTPSTQEVQAEPILITPAWIMKYYILDLSQRNSMVKYLVDQGFTVFMISWKNPGPEDRGLSMDDYRRLGVLAALQAVQAIVPGRQVHGVGYCLGGTLLAITAAALAGRGGVGTGLTGTGGLTRTELAGQDLAGQDIPRHGQSGFGKSPFASLSLLASQVDFSEAGELQLFIDESQLAFLDDMMWEQGFLDSKQMAGAFQMLHSNDLIWSHMVHDYLMGEREPLSDLMAWSTDATRMPYRMHSQYLRKLYLNNDLTEWRFEVDGRAITVSDIEAPIFLVGTEKDHIAPWHSVFKLNLFADTDLTFVLTTGGHNGGIISEPGHRHRSYKMRTHHERDCHIDPDTWAAQTGSTDGSWWLAWSKWLSKRSSSLSAPPAIGNAKARYRVLANAPGGYVLQR